MEGEAARFIFQGTEITVTIVKDVTKGMVQLIAFLRALSNREKIAGEVNLKNILRAGEQIVIGRIPEERMQDFIEKAKAYGLVYHGVYVPRETLIGQITEDRLQDFIKQAKESGFTYQAGQTQGEIIFNPRDEEKFISVLEKMGFTKEDVLVTEKNVYDVMLKRIDLEKFNTVIERIGLVKEDVPVTEFAVEDVRESVKDKLSNLDGKVQDEQAERQWNRQEISKMDVDEIRKSVASINSGNPEGFTSQKWRAYLEMQAVLYDYSTKNKERIYDQRPDATIVMSKTSWGDIGRSVSPNAQGIQILMPKIMDGQRTGEFVDAPIYDIADTVGSEVNIKAMFKQFNDAQMEQIVEGLKSERSVVMDEGLELLKTDALFDSEKNEIRLNPNRDMETQLLAMQRESIYAECFHEQGAAYNRSNNRFRAESVAYAMATKCGINASQYTFEYVDQLKVTPGLLQKQKAAVLKDISKQNESMKKILDKSKSRFVGKER